MNIGVAIVTYNNSRDIARCIASVRKEGLQHIAVVDSKSTDATQQELTRLGCEYQVTDENKGFGYAANKAARMLNTEYVLFINPDSHIQSGAVARVIQTITTHPHAGIIGMLLCSPGGKPEAFGYGDEPSMLKIITRRFFRESLSEKPFYTDWVSGGAFMISKKVFDDICGFDEGFFMYWEDVDLCKRVRGMGYKILMDPQARVTHMRGGSSMDENEKATIYDQSADRYFKKHYSTTIWYIQRLLRKWYRAYYSRPS